MTKTKTMHDLEQRINELERQVKYLREITDKLLREHNDHIKAERRARGWTDDDKDNIFASGTTELRTYTAWTENKNKKF